MDQEEVDIYPGDEAGSLAVETQEIEKSGILGMSRLLEGAEAKTGDLERGSIEDLRLWGVIDLDRRPQETLEIREKQGITHLEMT